MKEQATGSIPVFGSKLEPGVHLAVAFPQNNIPNDFTRKFTEDRVKLEDVLRLVGNLPEKITDTFEVFSLH